MPTHGLRATREAAMGAFAKSWRRVWECRKNARVQRCPDFGDRQPLTRKVWVARPTRVVAMPRETILVGISREKEAAREGAA